MLAISAEVLEVKTSDWPDCAELELLWLTRTAETGRPTTLGELVYPGNQPAENDQSVTTNPPAFLALTRHSPSSRASLEEAEGWVMRLRGTGCHSWCYYCRYDDQYRPSPWQSPRHVTMVSVVMTGGHGDISSRGMSGSSHLASLIPSPTRHLINICENRDGRDTKHQHRKKQGLYLM